MKVFNLRVMFVMVIGLLQISRLASQDAIFSQFYSTPLYLNPAFAGSRHDYRLVMNYRNQPFPDFGTFSTINASFDANVPDLFGGVGLIVTSDRQGPLLMKNHVSAVYAFHLQAASNMFINFGAQAGYYRQDLGWNKLEFASQIINNQNEDAPPNNYRHAADFAAGILLYSDWLYGGVAAHHLTRPHESFYPGPDGSGPKLEMKYTAHVGAFFVPPQTIMSASQSMEYFISPNLIVQNQGDFFRINYGLYAGIESLMAGFWFRQDLYNPNTLIFLVGMNTGKYRIGYSYDYSLSGFTSIYQGAHEISLSVFFDDEARKMRRRILNCPGF